MKSKALLGLSAGFVVGSLMATTGLADDRFEYHGYWRAGFLQNGKGGAATAPFQAPGAWAKYRLGNEADIYGENILVKKFQSGENGPTAKFETLLAYSDNQSNDWSTPGGWALREAFTEFGNFDFDKNVNFWAGKRFYGREDLHINDFYWLDSSGIGAGVGNVSLADTVKLDVAIIRGAADDAIIDNVGVANKLGADIRVKVGMQDLGDLMFVIQPMYAKGGDVTDEETKTTTSIDDQTGLGGSLVWSKGHSMGFNKVVAQYGMGVANNFSFAQWGLPSNSNKDQKLMRVMDFGVLAPMDNFSFMYDVIYQTTDSGADDYSKADWASAGVRPLYNFTKNFGLALEAGVDYTKTEYAGGDVKGTLGKLTICPEIRIDSNFWARPVLRGFVTLAKWSSDFEGAIGGPAYADKTAGMNWGFQMEAWF